MTAKDAQRGLYAFWQATMLQSKPDLKLPAALKIIQLIVSDASAEDVKSWPSWSQSRLTAGTHPWLHTWC